MGEVPEGSIVITPKEFYDGVRQDISDIKSALSPLSALSKDVEDLKARVGALEKRVIWATGFASAISMAAGFAVSLLV